MKPFARSPRLDSPPEELPWSAISSVDEAHMKPCPDCNEMISERADNCPKCGRVLRRPLSLGRIVLLLILISLVFTAIQTWTAK
jgi:hypothetical protein